MTLVSAELGVAAQGAARRRTRRLAGPMIGLCFVTMCIVLILTVFGSLLAPHDPHLQDLAHIMAPPSGAHWLGTDVLGRDVFSRVIAGTRSAVLGPLVIAGVSFLVGNLLGLLAGYRGGRLDSILMRWVDLMWSIPALLVLIVAAGAVGTSYWAAVGVLVVLTIPLDTRVIRGATLEQAPKPYVEAARTLGVPDRRIMFLHIWPNVAPIALANTFLVFASSVGILAALSFLGLGVAPGSSDWGLMLADNQAMIFTRPLACLAPGVMIVLTATSMNLIGDWLAERLAKRGGAR